VLASVIALLMVRRLRALVTDRGARREGAPL